MQTWVDLWLNVYLIRSIFLSSSVADGLDVFLVVVKLVGPTTSYNQALSLSAKNRRRIGGCGVLVYSTDAKRFQETDDNMDMLRRLRHFLLDAIIETD